MPNQVQKPPWGYLDLIGAKSNGQNPNQVADMVSSTVELLPFFLVGRQIDYSQSEVTKTLRDDRAVVQVPAGEIWWVQGISGFLNASAAGVIMSAVLRYRTRSSSFDQTVAYNDQPRTALAASSRLTLGWMPPQPLILSAGAQCLMILNEDTTAAGNVAMNVTVSVIRLNA